MHGADHEVTRRVYREPDDIQMLPNLSDINIRKNSPTHSPRSFPDYVSLPASLTVSTPCSQATFGSLLLQPLLISPTPLLHLAFQPVQFLLRLPGDLECAGERHADEREDVGEGGGFSREGSGRRFEKHAEALADPLEVLVCTFIGGGTL